MVEETGKQKQGKKRKLNKWAKKRKLKNGEGTEMK